MVNIIIPEQLAEDFQARVNGYITAFVGEPGKRTWGQVLELAGEYVRMGYNADKNPINVIAAYLVISSVLEEAAESLYNQAYHPAPDLTPEEANKELVKIIAEIAQGQPGLPDLEQIAKAERELNKEEGKNDG